MGCFFDNMPISLLEQKGYEDIVVIRLLDDFLGKINLNKYQNIKYKNNSTIRVFRRILK